MTPLPQKLSYSNVIHEMINACMPESVIPDSKPSPSLEWDVMELLVSETLHHLFSGKFHSTAQIHLHLTTESSNKIDQLFSCMFYPYRGVLLLEMNGKNQGFSEYPLYYEELASIGAFGPM
jgi:hypothetical protein